MGIRATTAQQLLQEGLRIRKDHSLNTFVGGNFCQLLGYFDCMIEAAKFINQSTLFGLCPGPNAPLSHRVDVLSIFVAASSDFRHEIPVVSGFNPIFKLGPFAVGKLFRLAKHSCLLASEHVFVGDAQPVVKTFQHRLAGHYANRPGDCRRLSNNLAGARRDVITTGSSNVAH